MSNWNKVEKEKEDWDLEDRTDFGWFVTGWFYDWFRGVIWEIVNKTKGNWNRISKDTGDFTKVEKEKEDWNKVTKE